MHLLPLLAVMYLKSVPLCLAPPHVAVLPNVSAGSGVAVNAAEAAPRGNSVHCAPLPGSVT